MSRAPFLNQHALRTMLHYDPETGVFTWRHRAELRPQWNGRYAGQRAGYEWTATGGGRYRSIRIYDWPFPEHRLAWLYMVGQWPEPMVDHRDGDGLNNRWANLREASKAQNSYNARKPRTNTSGFKGVSWHKASGSWRATICVGGRQFYLGRHRTPEEAHAAYVRAAHARSDFARAS